MAISKVIFKASAEATPEVWMDTTDKTADSGNMLNGTTALKNDGTTVTGNIQSQAAQTIYPSTSDQTIASGKYLTGTQTIKGVLLTNLSAGNIKKDVVVKVGDSADDDRITSVTGTYEGGGGGLTLLASDEVTVNTTSTTSTVVKTLNVPSAWTASKIILVTVTDKAGARSGYFYGTYRLSANTIAKMGSTSTAIINGMMAYGSLSAVTSSTYGVYWSKFSINGDIEISSRYNSGYGAINGTYKINVYAVDIDPFPY